MIAIDEEQCLELVKKSNLITGNYLDDMLSQKIKEVKSFMIFSGVAEDVVNSDIAIGTIAIGVNDLYSPQGTSGAQKFSEYFFQRVYQLR